MDTPDTARGKRIEAEVILKDINLKVGLALNLLNWADMQEKDERHERELGAH